MKRQLVLLHGGGTDHRCFAHVVPLLAPRFDLLTPDLPGHGEAPPPPSVSVEAVAATLAERIEDRLRPGYALLGHSFGGMVAMAFAATVAPPPDRLILCDTFAKPADGWEAWGRILAMGVGARVLGRRRANDVITKEMALGGDGPDAPVRASMYHEAAWPLHTMLRAVRRFDGRPHLARIACPTLLLMAGGNPATDGAGEKAARRLRNARVEIMPRVGHLQMRDDPAGFADAVTWFVDGAA